MRASCAVVNGAVYVGSDDGYLYAFGSPSDQPSPSYNITVGGSSPTSSPNSEVGSSPELSSAPPPTPSPEVMPDPISISTKAVPMTLLGIVLGIVIVAMPIVVVISACLLFYFKKRKR